MIVAGTGHRPDKLGGYDPEVYYRLVNVAQSWLNDKLRNADIEAVISGMALGWDQALAEAALIAGIPLYAYIPFAGQEGKWPSSSQHKFHRILGCAAKVVECSEPGYAAWKMQHRNKRMVDDCDLVLAMWNGSDGGTANCVEYAVKRQKTIVNLWDKYNEGTET